mmetsp:Transcript_95615/g.270561  ORF Transcript_95615/g.270561 Transcript_95615/m.270561 type:complete len:204 (+) Transcript_95615:802-1413(+)
MRKRSHTTRNAASISSESASGVVTGKTGSAARAGGRRLPSRSAMSSTTPSSPMEFPSSCRTSRCLGGPGSAQSPRASSRTPRSVTAHSPRSSSTTELPPKAAPRAAAPSSPTWVPRKSMPRRPQSTCRNIATVLAPAQVMARSPAKLKRAGRTVPARARALNAKQTATTSASPTGREVPFGGGGLPPRCSHGNGPAPAVGLHR